MQIGGAALSFRGAFVHPSHTALVVQEILLGQRTYALAGIALAGLGPAMTLGGTWL